MPNQQKLNGYYGDDFDKKQEVIKDLLLNKKVSYDAENCRISTPKQNSNNKTNNRILNISGEEMTMAQAADKYNIKRSTLLNRLNRGMNDYDAIHKINRNKKYR